MRQDQHFVDGGSRAWYRYDRPYAEDDHRDHQLSRDLAYAASQRENIAVVFYQGEDGYDGQTDVGHVIEDESQYPVRSGFQPQVRRKDYVPRSEKHGEESEADDEYVQIITFHCDCPS